MTEQELQEIKERLEKATPGPWWYDTGDIGDEDCCIVPTELKGGKRTIVGYEGGFAPDEEWTTQQVYNDAEFIAHAPEDIRRLLDEVERLRNELGDIRERGRKFMDWLYKKQEAKRESAQNSRDDIAALLFEAEAEMVDEVIQKMLEE